MAEQTNQQRTGEPTADECRRFILAHNEAAGGDPIKADHLERSVKYRQFIHGLSLETIAMMLADLEPRVRSVPGLLEVARMAMQPERDSYDQYDDWHARLKEAASAAIAKAEGK